ncbi:EPIDERMAL PATTERNING FACTOR-like protein 9 [Cornus florida]|uniref:EPIDERMAL PATTERNING FACTOR-like protein 9 n=1 Tax=Cornus florida TaxID=4283 RepID=UPI00289F6532|nr:EPIDERMAL PATTERNING FACTOR-like protein 9 [Cornus florida]
MANIKNPNSLLLLPFTLVCAAYVIQGVAGSKSVVVVPLDQMVYDSSLPGGQLHLQGSGKDWMKRSSRRSMIGSTAPTCTYNECRGCKYKCRAEQVPVEGNDLINSPYHYKCVCHR